MTNMSSEAQFPQVSLLAPQRSVFKYRHSGILETGPSNLLTGAASITSPRAKITEAGLSRGRTFNSQTGELLQVLGDVLFTARHPEPDG
jgi:hypothetical protein